MAKYIQIANDLKSGIYLGKYTGNDHLPTEKELADMYRVSRQSVRQALSVLEKEGLIEKKQGSGSYLTEFARMSRYRTRRVAVITTYVSEYIFPGILRSMQDILYSNRCSVELFDTRNNVVRERSILETICASSFDGLLVEGTKTAIPNPNIDLYYRITSKNMPVVFFNGNYRDIDCPFVLDDNYSGGQMLVDYLYLLGHRKIAGIFKSDDIQGIERYHGFIDAMKKHGLIYNSANVIWYYTESLDALFDSEYIIGTADNSTAFVCYNDMVANKLIDYLTARGKNVPQNISVVSFDNSYISELGPVTITSLSHGSADAGQRSASMLLDLMDGRLTASEIRPEYLPWKIIEKNSSRKL